MEDNTSQEVHHHHYHRPQKDPSIAILLEILPGIFIQTFGIGNIYAGNVALGIILMLSYWVLAVINFFLIFILIGFVTYPMTWIIYMVVSTILANQAAKKST